MTQVMERPFTFGTAPAQAYEAVRCPVCNHGGPEVSGAWTSLRWKCKRCNDYREVERLMR